MVRSAVIAALAACSTLAVAQDRRPDYGTAVTATTAKKIAAAVIGECQKNSWNVAVAVVDNHGYLVYFERMDNTQTASMDVAVGKARSRGDLSAHDPCFHGSDQQGTGDGLAARHLRLARRDADHGRRQSHRRSRSGRRHRRPG